MCDYFSNNLFHPKELDIEWAKPEQPSFLHLYSENTHISGEHWKKFWKDTETPSLTITHLLPCSVGRNLNLSCVNFPQVSCSLSLHVSVHKESKTGEENHKAFNHLNQVNQMTKNGLENERMGKEWAVGWTKNGQIPGTLFPISETHTCHQEWKGIYFLLSRY